MLTFIFIPRYANILIKNKELFNRHLTFIRPAKKSEVERFKLKDKIGYDNPRGAKMRHTQVKE